MRSLLYLTATRPENNDWGNHMYIQGAFEFGIEYVKGKVVVLIGYYDSDWA